MDSQHTVDLVPFLALMTVVALAAFSPLNKIPRLSKIFLFADIGGAVAAAILIAATIVGNISNGVWIFDVVISLSE